MRPMNFAAKAEHFSRLADMAAINAAYAQCAGDRTQWDERAARYDAQAESYRLAARKAA